MNDRIKVAVVIINFNSSLFTQACIQSIHQQTTGNDYHIVVVDNNSQGADYLKLKESLQVEERVTLVRSKINLGFSGGNMFGVQFAPCAEYYCFLNNDTILKNDLLSLLAQFLSENKEAALCTGQMLNDDLSPATTFGHLPSSALMLLGEGAMRTISKANYPKKRTVYAEPVSVPYITGACLFFDARRFNELGGFDTNYFLYCEEEDLCQRLKLAGLKTYFVPSARFVHFQGQSTETSYAIKREYYISLLYFLRKFKSTANYRLFQCIYFFKLIKKFNKNLDFVKLAFFVVRGAPMRNSLRHKLKIGSSV